MADYSVDIRMRFDNGPTLTVPYSAPFSIKQTRGVDAYMFALSIHDDVVKQFPKGGNTNGIKVRFWFSTPGESGGRAEASWGLYLVRCERSSVEPQQWRVTFADERWVADYQRVTKSYNIQWPDGSYREETLNKGQRWLVADAIDDAIKSMGFVPDTSRLRNLKITPPILLPNLGNSDGGGWTHATWSSVLGPMLNQVHCDLVIGFDYTWVVVPRTAMETGGRTAARGPFDAGFNASEPIKRLKAMRRLSDSAEAPIIYPEKPRKLRVGFEIMTEAVIESAHARGTATGRTAFAIPQNVMLRLSSKLLEPNEWWNDQITDGVADTDWVKIADQLVELGYAADESAAEELVRKNWFLPNIIPFKRAGEFDEIAEDTNPTRNSIAYQKKVWISDMLRKCWRRFYKVKFPTAADSPEFGARSLSGIRFGRLTPGGDSRSRGSVFCDWCEESVHALNFTGNPLDAVFSDNHQYDSTRAAPFTAQWVDKTGNEMVFELVPAAATRISQAKIFPGLFAVALNYGDWMTLSGDGYMRMTEINGEFDDRFRYRLYCAGLLTREDTRSGVSSTLGTVQGRVLIVERDLYPDGAIQSLDVRVDGATANFGYTKAQMDLSLGSLAGLWPGALLNRADLGRLVDNAELKARAQFDQGVSGGITIAGVSPMQANIITEGDIHEMSVVVGDPDEWSIQCQYIIVPGVAVMDIEPKDRAGPRPELIAKE